MKEYDFALVASSVRKLDAETLGEIANALYSVGADDCTVASNGNALVIEFDRESDSYRDAVMSAIRQVHSVGGLKVKSVDAGQYVGLSDAAELCGLTRSALSKFSKGERGDGKFPTPYLRLSSTSPLYEWAEIADWLQDKGFVSTDVVENARFTSLINAALNTQKDRLEEISALVAELN